MYRRAALVIVLMLLSGCGTIAGTASPPAGTLIVPVSLLGADQRVATGWTIRNADQEGTIDCNGPFRVALSPNIQSCGSSADGAPACWAPPGQNLIYCGDDPWSHTARRLYSEAQLSAVPASIEPQPWGVTLTDGSRCAVRVGGAWPFGPDRSSVTYICGEQDPTSYLVAPEGGGTTFDKSGVIWKALSGELEVGGVTPPPAVAVDVEAAFFAT